jgi:hypothetical protein
VAGLPVGTQTIAHAFKEYGASVGVNYTAHYIGKWGIGVRGSHSRAIFVLKQTLTKCYFFFFFFCREPRGKTHHMEWVLISFGMFRYLMLL